MCTTLMSKLWNSGITELIKDETGLLEILSNLQSKGYIDQVTYFVNSDLFGPGTPRSELLFPREVFFPSTHKLNPGKTNLTLSPRLVSANECRYVFSGIVNIGISEVANEDIPRMKEAKGGSFVGCLDNNPFGLLLTKITPPVSPPKGK